MNQKGIMQIACGLALLVVAFYFGQASSGKSPIIVPPSSMKAADLSWETAPTAPPLVGTISTEPVKSREPFVDTENRQGPMLKEPDFSGLERALSQHSKPVIPEPERLSKQETMVESQPPAGSTVQDIHASLPPLPLPSKRNSGMNDGNHVAGFATPPPVSSNNSGVEGGYSILRGKERDADQLVPIQVSRTDQQNSQEPSNFKLHIVRPGETLQSISTEYYQSPVYYLDIYAANRDLLASPASIRSGQSLRIPVGEGE